jgi:diphthine synthase
MSDPQSAISVYNTIHENLKVGNHTLILTEYDNNNEKDFLFLNPNRAIDLLKETEKDLKYGIILDKTFVIIGSRIGHYSQKIQSGEIHSFDNFDFGDGPHSIIIPGQLHFTETDLITSVYLNLDKPSDNSKLFQHLAVRMVNKYLPKAKDAIKTMKSFLEKENSTSTDLPNTSNNGMFEVLENAEYYLLDSERFLNQNKHELALLSIGYAEGLIDSLRLQKNIKPWLS